MSDESEDKKLLEDIINFIKQYLEIPNEGDYLLLALWVMHTYLIEKFDTTPILYFYGVKETGKSRAGEILSQLAFRGQKLTSITEATLFREAQTFKTSLVIDEITLWGRHANHAAADLIKSRYKRGTRVPRINQNKKGEEQIEYFDVFGPLVICSTEIVPDTIESRCLVFIMQKNINSGIEGEINLNVAKGLRDRLILFRAKFLSTQLSEIEPLARRRLGEITKPLGQILHLIDEGKVEELKHRILEIEEERNALEYDSTEASILKAVSGIFQERGGSDSLQIKTRDITEEVRKQGEIYETPTDRLIALRMKRMAFRNTRIDGTQRGFIIRKDFLETLKSQYNIAS